MKKVFLALLVFVSIPLYLKAQIINIEQLRISTDTVGFKGTASISFSASQFTRSFMALNGALQLQLDKPINYWLFVFDYDLVNAGGVNINNRAITHLRYSRKINKYIALEGFNQLQSNTITKIVLRSLFGSGFRFNLSQTELLNAHFGITYMYEYEELKEPSIINRDHRMSSYLSLAFKANNKFILTNTLYYQPLANKFSDYRFSDDFLISFNITSRLKFQTTLNFLYDSKPPEEIPKVNYVLRNGFSYSF